MGYDSGSVSFQRFAVLGDAPSMPDEALLAKLQEHAFAEREIGVPDEIEYGWCGGRHILDGRFSFEHNVFADCLHFAIRIDTCKFPSSLKKAYQIMEEEATAAQNPSGFISKLQKRDVKQAIQQKIDDEMRSGKFRKSKMIPMLWDLTQGTLYCSASSQAMEKVRELFERTFGLELLPLSAGSVALRLLERKARRREYEDLRPTRFVYGPEGEGVYPEYPWVMKGPEPKDFIGNEFLLWLWHEAEAKTGIIRFEGRDDITVYLDRSLDLDCAYGQTGRDGLRGNGPAKMPEARDGLRTGKVPRKAGLIIHTTGHQFDLTFSAENLAVAGAKLPDVEEADSPRTLFEERIAMLRELSQTLDALLEGFLAIRASSAWDAQCNVIRKWISQGNKPAGVVAYRELQPA